MTSSISFVDSNIFIYCIGRDHPLKPHCVAAIQQIKAGQVTAIVSTEIIQEILYRFQSIKALSLGIRLAREAMLISPRILPVTGQDVLLAMEIIGSNRGIETRAAFHAATMINNGIKEILSADAHFDQIPEITRIAPESFRRE